LRRECIFHLIDANNNGWSLHIRSVAMGSSWTTTCHGTNKLTKWLWTHKGRCKLWNWLEGILVKMRLQSWLHPWYISRLYCASEAWLLATLNEGLLHSQPGKILKIVDKVLSYLQLHKKYNYAMIICFKLYQTCINYYKIIRVQGYMPTEKAKVLMNTTWSIRNDCLVFIPQNHCKCGFNYMYVSNHLRSVTNVMKKDWMLVEKSALKHSV